MTARRPAIPDVPATERPLRVLHVIDDLGLGGAQRQLVNVATSLPADQVVQRVLVLSRDTRLGPRLQEHGIAVRTPGTSAGLLGLLRAARREMKAFRPDVVHTRLVVAPLVARCAGLGVRAPRRHVCSVGAMWYSAVQKQDNPAHDMRKSEVLRLLDKWTGRFADVTYVASSRAVADMLRDRLRVPDGRLHVVHNGTEAAPTDGDRPVRRLGASPVVLTVGRLSPEKGQRFLVDAVAELRRSGTEVALRIVGEGPLRDLLTRRARERGVADLVTLVGAVADVRTELAGATTFAFPSLHEGFGVAVIEAMAAGVPVVASDIPAMREILGDTAAGLLVPPEDVGALAGALRASLEPGWAAAASLAARRRVRDSFTASVTAARYLDVYRALVRA